jgi:type IV pilus assembly protein PilC
MATFKYTAQNAESRTITGKISAESQEAVIEELRKRKLTIISIVSVKGAAVRRAPFQSKKVKGEEIVIFARQLATMVEAGIPIIQGLDALAQQVTHPLLKKVLGSVRDDIEHGTSLSVAFAKNPQVFDSLFINMVKVGETGGVLSAVLDRIATYMEKTLRLQRKIKAALIYPIVVISMAIIITIVLLVKVVPTFTQIYASFNQELPGMTQLLVNTSETLRHQLLWYIGGIMMAVFALRQWHRTEKGALVIDGITLKLPIIGDLLRKVAISRFSRT